MYTAEKLAIIFGCTVPDLMDINREILKSCQIPHAVSAIPELVGHILERIPSSNFRPHLLEVSPIWRAEAEQVLWKRHKKAEEGEGIRNCELHELKWKAYQKACKELSEARKEHGMVRWALERCGFQIYVD
ncbi:hypothetical protein GLOIN_2v1785889 [Rhizophagus irregularis DAOM 181602=DAOM 197198]|nr:hypothetical protein GLOIN_2v1785889 [Rhizophagus irregularis DAOM 181602=DAOM 197198]